MVSSYDLLEIRQLQGERGDGRVRAIGANERREREKVGGRRGWSARLSTPSSLFPPFPGFLSPQIDLSECYATMTRILS